jgi:hypothetical protein
VLKVSLAGTGVSCPTARPTSCRSATARRCTPRWRLHYEHVRHSLETAYYQGWDLHPGNCRRATPRVHVLHGRARCGGARLSNFVGKAAQATLVGDVFDDAATGQGLLNYFSRAIDCGAISEAEAVERTGLTLEDFQGKSFLAILKRRRG